MSEAATPKKKSKKLVFIALAVLVLAAGGGGGAWWFLKPKGDAAEAAHAPKKPAAKPVFANLEPFTVNLQDERGERFAQIGVTLEVDDAQVEVDLKDRLPTVRNNILLLISSKRVEDLLTPEGKSKLAADIRDRAGAALGFEAPAAPAAPAAAAASAPAPARHAAAAENPIRNVLFSTFIVQ